MNHEALRHGKQTGASPICAAIVSTLWACVLVGAIMGFELLSYFKGWF